MRSRAYISIFIILVLLSSGLVLSAGGTNVYPGGTTRVGQGEYTHTKMYGDDDEIKKIIVDDIDPANPGNEVVIVGRSEKVKMIAGSHETWNARTLYQDKWLIESADYGEFYPGHPGKEMAICGWSDWVSIVYEEKGKWKGHMIFNDGDILYDVKICDVYPGHDGNELVYVGEKERVEIGYHDGTGWKNITAYQDTWYLSNILYGDFDATIPGSELYVTGGSNKIIQIHYNGTWKSKKITGASSVRDITFGDVLPTHPGDEIVYCSGPDLFLLYQNATVNGTGNTTYEWVKRKIYTDSKYISAVSVGDILPEDYSPGPEIFLATRSNYGLVLRYISDTDTYLDTYPYTNPTYLSACAVGDFDKSHDGVEGVVGGLQGRVVKVQYEKEDFSVIPLQEQVHVTKGHEGSFYFIVDGLGGYNRAVRFSLEQTTKQGLESNGMTVTLSTSKVTPLGLLFLNVSASGSTPTGTYPLTLTCSSDGVIDGAIREKHLYLNVTIIDTNVPNFRMRPLSYYQNIVGDFAFTTRIEISMITGSAIAYLDSWRVPVNANATFPGSMDLAADHYFNITFRSTANTVPGRYIISISGKIETSTHTIIHHAPLVVDVNATGDPDFALDVDYPLVEVHKNTTGNQTIMVQSIFGFMDSVQVSVEDIPEGVAWKLSSVAVVPTANVTLSITPSLNATEGDYDIKVVASRGGVKKDLVFMLRVLPPIPDFRIFFFENYMRENVTEDSHTLFLTVGIMPVFEFKGDIELDIIFEHNARENISVSMKFNDSFFLEEYKEETIELKLGNLNKQQFINITANATLVGDEEMFRKDEMVLEIWIVEEEDNGEQINWGLIAFIVIAVALVIAAGIYLFLRSTGKLAPKDIKETDDEEKEDEKPEIEAKKAKKEVMKKPKSASRKPKKKKK